MKITKKHFDKYPGFSPKEIIEKEESDRYSSKLPKKDKKNRAERLDEQTIKINEDR